MTGGEPPDWAHQEPEVARGVAVPLADRLRNARASLTYRWLERIKDRVDVDENEVFPTEDLLDHVPLLISAVADFMEDPAEEGTAADEVLAKSAELGEMRFDQGFSTYQVLKEFEILGGVILDFLRTRVTRLGFTPDPDDIVLTTHRVYRALSKVQQSTAARHITLLEEERRELDHRLRLVARLVERMMEAEDAADGAGSATLRDERNARRLRGLLRLADTGRSSRRSGVPLEGAVKEAMRRVRAIAQKANVEVRIAGDLPDVSVPDAAVEHCLVVYLTNALRHCAEADGECRVDVTGAIDAGNEEVVVRVRNTGAPVEATDDITTLAGLPEGNGETAGPFDDVAGPGVGLHLAEELIRMLRGRTWAEPASGPAGAIFGLAFPSRRHEDGEAAEGDSA